MLFSFRNTKRIWRHAWQRNLLNANLLDLLCSNVEKGSWMPEQEFKGTRATDKSALRVLRLSSILFGWSCLFGDARSMHIRLAYSDFAMLDEIRSQIVKLRLQTSKYVWRLREGFHLRMRCEITIYWKYLFYINYNFQMTRNKWRDTPNPGKTLTKTHIISSGKTLAYIFWKWI